MHRSGRAWIDPAPGQPRLFVAVPLPPTVVAAIEALVETVRAAVDDAAPAPRSPVRWVRLDGLHLTLRFLGPTPADRVAPLIEAVDRAAGQVPRIAGSIGGAGAFPSAARPRTLWLAVPAGATGLDAAAHALSVELEASGWPRDDRPFRPHLTLARSDGRREGPLVARTLAAQARDLRVPFEADRLVLYESVTGGGPARYVPLHEAVLT